ncbi:hypothetical protein GCM10009559_33260 [Pseudonocardia zijingensis]|uniref:Uncharacterized protein n=1 Tax=Pseudonocardia zijingensis TaxID=153376 RepID=A0ABN1Q8C2_9PSEU
MGGLTRSAAPGDPARRTEWGRTGCLRVRRTPDTRNPHRKMRRTTPEWRHGAANTLRLRQKGYARIRVIQDHGSWRSRAFGQSAPVRSTPERGRNQTQSTRLTR